MSVVASVAINVDSSQAVTKLRQVEQGAQATSQAVNKLNATNDALAASFTKSGKPIETAANGMRYFIDATGRARKENGQFVTTAEAAAAGLKKQGEAARTASGLLRGVGAAVASIGAGALVAGMVRGAAAAEQLQLRLKLLSAEYGETARVQQFVSESAKTFGQSQVEASQGVADVYARLRPLGVSLNQIEAIYKGFNATALASGTSAEAASGAFLQLSQALGSGTLQGDEFRSIAEQVPGILRLVAGEMGVTVGELKKLGSEGKITSDILINALARGFDENSSKVKTLLDQSPAQRFKEFKDATQELSNAIGSQLLPAITPVVKLATELLRLFGSLPGPVQTLIAAVFGLTAAFVALAPPITAVIGLLGPAGIAGLIAAGPWIALAAGITAATVALAGYRTESQRVSQSLGAKARGGNAGDLARAQNRAVELQQEISLAQRRQAGRTGGAGGGRVGVGGQRSAAGTILASKRAELAQLQRDIAQGQQAAPSVTSMPPLMDARSGGGGGGGGGGSKGRKGATDAEKAAEKAAREAERLAQLSKEQLDTAQQSYVLAEAGLAVSAAVTDNEKLQAEYDKQRAERMFKYSELLKNALSDKEREFIVVTQEYEVQKAQLELNKNLYDVALKQSELLNQQTPLATIQQEIELLAAKIQGKEQEYLLQKQINELISQGVSPEDAQGVVLTIKDLEKQNKVIQDQKQLWADIYTTVSGELQNALTGLIDGTAKWGDVLSSILGSLGNLFLNAAFSGLGGALKLPGFAEGGFVTGPTTAMIGEGGEPEYVIPASKMRSAMGRYAGGARGASVIPGNGESGGGGMGAAPSGTIDVRYSIERINSVDYVTADQFQRGMAQAAQQGAIQGERRAMRSLKNSAATRRGVGV